MVLVQKEVKRIMMRPNGQEKQIRPAKRNPGANTVVYFPLETDSIDHSNNNVPVSYSGSGITYTTLSTGKKVAQFSHSCIYTADTFIQNYLSSHTYTINYWCNVTNPNSNNWQFIISSSGTVIEVGSVTANGGKQFLSYGNNQATGNTVYPYDTWRNVCIVVSGGTISMYINNSFYVSATLVSRTTSRLGVGGRYQRSGDLMLGKMSEFIIENKARTAQEVSDYYDQTKGTYGL